MPPFSRASFDIRANDRVFLVGSSGSGKTTLAKALLWKLPNLIVCDPKRTFTLPDEWAHMTYDTLAQLKRHRGPSTAIYLPSSDDLDALCEPFFAWVFARKDTTLYIDEVGAVTTPQRMARSLGRCLREGRALGISVWSATQRPTGFPLTVMTESEHFFIFRLRNPEDRIRVGRYTASQIAQRIPEGHNFWYYNDRTGKLKYAKGANIGRVLG